MATLTQIGAVIGMKGAKEYLDQLKVLTQYTKEFASETKVLTSSFDENKKSIKNVSDLRASLKTQIEGLNNVLRYQQEELDKVNSKFNEGQGLIGKQAEGYSKLNEELNNTKAQINELEQELKNLPSTIKLVSEAWDNATSDLGEVMVGIGKTLTKTITVPLVASATASVKYATDIESAFTGVRKTVEETDTTNYEKLKNELFEIATYSASTTEEIMGVAEVAGQLGIVADDIPEFTRNVIMLADSTNIVADEGATNIAKFLNIMGESPTTINDFGNAIVALGNNYATTESDILSMATRLASAGNIVGLTTPGILGLATAMSSLGITSEAGGTAMSTTMKRIAKAVASGEDELELFAEAAGTTAEDFAETWRTNPIEAIQEFLIGLANLEGGSEELLLLLDDLGISGIRESDTVQRLTLGYEGLTSAVEMANEEYYNGNALSEEASKRYEDFASKLSQLKEAFKQFASVVGESIVKILKPIVEDLTITFKSLRDWWNNLSEPMQNFILGVAGVVAAIGPLLVVGGNALIFFAKIKTSLATLGVTWATISGIVSSFGSVLVSIATGPIGVIVASIAGLAAVLTAFGVDWGEVWEMCKWLFSDFGNIMSGILETLKIGFSQIWDDIKTSVTTKAKAIYNETIKDFNRLKADLSNIHQSVKTFVLNIWENIKNGVRDKLTSLGNVITNGFSSAVSYIKSLPSQAWGWGSDMISSFASGITSRISSVVSSVSSLASKVKSYLHFSEPDVGPLSDFHTWMPDMMKGLAKGIDDNMYLVDNAMNRLASGMNLGNSVSYGGVTINLNMPQGANGEQVLDQIENAIANRTIRRRMVFN